MESSILTLLLASAAVAALTTAMFAWLRRGGRKLERPIEDGSMSHPASALSIAAALAMGAGLLIGALSMRAGHHRGGYILAGCLLGLWLLLEGINRWANRTSRRN